MTSTHTSPVDTENTTPAANYSWRVVDIVVCAVIAVAVGLLFRLWASLWAGFELIFATSFPPAVGIFGGLWVLAGPLAGLIIRKPGAALFGELLAAIVEAVLGSHFGVSAIMSGFLQGLGAELVFAAFRYRVWNLTSAILAAMLAALFMGIHESIIFFAEWPLAHKAAYTGLEIVSASIISGLAPWVLTLALASSGALNAFAAGKTGREV